MERNECLVSGALEPYVNVNATTVTFCICVGGDEGRSSGPLILIVGIGGR
jgi:hypothetical protein